MLISLMHEAISAGDTAALRRLVKQGGDVRDLSEAVRGCVERDDRKVLRALLKLGANSDERPDESQWDEVWESPLVIASQLSRHVAARVLLDAGANPNHHDELGYGPLMYARLNEDRRWSSCSSPPSPTRNGRG